jgi:hypothetical protein
MARISSIKVGGLILHPKSVDKVVYTTTPEKMFRSFMEQMTELLLDSDSIGTASAFLVTLKEITVVLLANPVKDVEVISLFRKGNTFLLVPEALPEFDRKDVLREVVVEIRGREPIVIDHTDISF